jgi:hypothetical protein
VRRAGVFLLSALCAASVGVGPGSASAADDAGAAGDPGATVAPAATITCQPVATPGRVRCDVQARVAEGERIAWGDVVLVRVAPFASALRGRIGPHAATIHEPREWLWPLALVAREKGHGTVEGRVRLVVCRDGACTPRSIDVAGTIDVGG